MAEKKKGLLRGFWDFFILFTGISTASNLTRSQGGKVRSRGLFLVREKRDKPADGAPDNR